MTDSYLDFANSTLGARIAGALGLKLADKQALLEETKAGKRLERLLEAKVFLEVWVKVRSGWADDEAHLRSYGYE